jgi:hypothetical protein
VIARNWRAEAPTEGLTAEKGTLDTLFLGRGVGSAVEEFDSFAESVLSDSILALFARGTSSSSLELLKNKYTLQTN